MGVPTDTTLAPLAVDVDPADVGFDADRLRRIDRHFARYVDDGRLPGWSVLVSRRGRIAHLATYGRRDIDSSRPVELDTIFRLYSMTKPITSVAALMLHEEGTFALTDPVSKFIPEFADTRVYKGGPAQAPTTRPALEPVRIWHLLTHTAGLTYGFAHAHPVDAMYRAAGFEWARPQGWDLARCCQAWGQLPLLFDPGTEWNYSHATDVLGRVVEVASGLPLDEFLAERIFGPLRMVDTGFWVDADRADRLATLYGPGADGRATPLPALALDHRPTLISGGGGSLGTLRDYHRFVQMLLRGGELDGVRLLGTRTVADMMRNHLPGNADLATIGRPLAQETIYEGLGFGLGGSVLLDPVPGKVLGSKGEFAWGGAASTTFWVDPTEEITVVFLTQLLPSNTHAIRPELRGLVYQALVD